MGIGASVAGTFRPRFARPKSPRCACMGTRPTRKCCGRGSQDCAAPATNRLAGQPPSRLRPRGAEPASMPSRRRGSTRSRCSRSTPAHAPGSGTVACERGAWIAARRMWPTKPPRRSGQCPALRPLHGIAGEFCSSTVAPRGAGGGRYAGARGCRAGVMRRVRARSRRPGARACRSAQPIRAERGLVGCPAGRAAGRRGSELALRVREDRVLPLEPWRPPQGHGRSGCTQEERNCAGRKGGSPVRTASRPRERRVARKGDGPACGTGSCGQCRGR